MGCTAEGLDAFKKHAWFEGIDWDLLAKKEATPPFEPDVMTVFVMVCFTPLFAGSILMYALQHF